MQNLPDILLDTILLPKYYKSTKKLTINQKIYLHFHFKNIFNINQELTKYINQFNNFQNCIITNFINPDHYYLSKKPIFKFLLYQSLVKKLKSINHLIPSNNTSNYNFLRFIFNNYNLINNFNNNTTQYQITNYI